ncbi:PRTRC system protein E [Maribacter sp.]|uniref:PRTRC system protein E n=1 Tax=Maribacter sp. TaxID=1897614 RepID=UPI0025C31833|nr:PRTRC system protein E [Maribacter sp.]
MTTNFFSQLALLGKFNTTLAITRDDANGLITVSFLPKPYNQVDNATKLLKPLNLTATADEMDSLFFDTVKTPVEDTVTFFNNAESYMEQKTKAEKQAQMEKDRTEKLKKAEKELKDLIADTSKIKENAKKITAKAIALKGKDIDNKIAQDAIALVHKNTRQEGLF